MFICFDGVSDGFGASGAVPFVCGGLLFGKLVVGAVVPFVVRAGCGVVVVGFVCAGCADWIGGCCWIGLG